MEWILEAATVIPLAVGAAAGMASIHVEERRRDDRDRYGLVIAIQCACAVMSAAAFALYLAAT